VSNLTNDEITERIKFVTMDEEDGVPGAWFAREMAEEVLKLRAELAALAPLAEAAVALYDAHIEFGAEQMGEKPDATTLRIRRSECEASELAIRKTAFTYARAQAQDGGK